MRAHPVLFRPGAKRDVTSIFNYILKISNSHAVAEGYIDRLYAFCLRIGHVPKGGRPILYQGKKYRRLVFERSLVVIYVVKSDTISIVRIYSGRRNLRALRR